MSTTKWNEILELIDSFSDKCAGPIWFRGHSNTSYALKAGLFRLKLDNINDYLILEQQFYNHYKNLGHLLHGGEEGWPLLYSMQHYGVKTRLLDWTESLAVALFFAAKHWTGSNTACIWLLNPIELNHHVKSEKKIFIPSSLEFPYDSTNTVAIYPLKNNTRISVQHGMFTIQGNTLLPLDQEFGQELFDRRILTKIDLPFTVREDVLRFLKKNGINHYSLFPDLDGLAMFLNQTLIKPAWE